MNLADAAETLACEMAFWFVAFEDETALAIEELGDVSVRLCDKLRALAITVLLTKGHADTFLHHLVRSGRVREAYLRRMRQAGRSDDRHFASGRVDALLDAVAAGDLRLAGRIAWFSPRAWEPAREYEDDFCYAQILHRIVAGVRAAEIYRPFLERFERALQGQASPRLALARAFVARSQRDFDDAFEGLIQARDDEIREDIARCQLEDVEVVAGRRVFVEGLAWLRLATVAGLATQADYLFCPANARSLMTTPVPDAPAGPVDDDA